MSISELARDEIRGLKPCIHGGDVWQVASNYNFRVKDIIDFSSNINPLGPSKTAIEAILNNLWQIPYYPDPDYIELRKAISKHLGNVNVNNIVVGNGSTELIYLFAFTFIERGDSALIPIPTFSEYEKAVKRAGGRAIYINLDKGFRVRPKNLIDKMGSSIKAIFLCNPNNPTGILTPIEDTLEIVEAALRKNILVFIDESFVEFAGQRHSLASRIDKYPNLFILKSLTKVFGLAGLRIGYGVAGEDIARLLSRANIPWNINCLAQVATIAALGDKEYLKRSRSLIKREREYMLTELNKIRGLDPYPSDANFILIDIRRTRLTASQLRRRLLKHGILIRDCSSFKGLDKYYIRISIKTREDNERLIEKLKMILK